MFLVRARKLYLINKLAWDGGFHRRIKSIITKSIIQRSAILSGTYLAVLHQPWDEEPGQVLLEQGRGVEIEQLAQNRAQLRVARAQSFEKSEIK